MKTYPPLLEDGSLAGFEVTSMWLTLWPLLKLLRSAVAVSEVRRGTGSDERISFKCCDKAAVVYEPWGDGSRYWVGLVEPDAFREIDITPLHEAFKNYRIFWSPDFWRRTR